MSKDFYSVLGVNKSANEDEIKAAYRKLAHQHHPDKQGGDASKFKEINEAYQVLGNKEKRAKYNQFGSAAFDGSGGFGGGGFNPNDFQGVNVDFGDLGDIFGSVFGMGGRGGRSQPSRGSDIEIDLELAFKEAAFGVERDLHFRKGVRCERCAGDGAEPGSKLDECKTCHGAGKVQAATRTMFGVMQTVRECADCEGRGKKPEKTCSNCHGSGVDKKEIHLKVKIPAGVDEGGIMKLRGEGEAGQHGTTAGDLYIHLHVANDDEFERDGSNVMSRRHLGMTQAALGDSVDVETIHGPVSLKIPSGTQSGTEFRLRGKGIQGGDHFVTVVVDVPTKLSREQRKLLEELDLKV